MPGRLTWRPTHSPVPRTVRSSSISNSWMAPGSRSKGHRFHCNSCWIQRTRRVPTATVRRWSFGSRLTTITGSTFRIPERPDRRASSPGGTLLSIRWALPGCPAYSGGTNARLPNLLHGISDKSRTSRLAGLPSEASFRPTDPDRSTGDRRRGIFSSEGPRWYCCSSRVRSRLTTTLSKTPGAALKCTCGQGGSGSIGRRI